MLAQIKNIEEYLPFPLLGFNSDSGGEFINHHLIRYLKQEKSPGLISAVLGQTRKMTMLMLSRKTGRMYDIYLDTDD